MFKNTGTMIANEHKPFDVVRVFFFYPSEFFILQLFVSFSRTPSSLCDFGIPSLTGLICIDYAN